MSKETPVPLQFAPGVVMTQSPLAAAGRYMDCSWVRFWRGKAQKVGGYIKLNATGLIGVPRGSTSWSDSVSRQLVGVGTSSKLYFLSDADYIYNDITPWRVSTTVANPITTAAGSQNVNIAYTAHGASVGDYVDISGASNVSTFAPNGSWPISAIVDANNFTILAPANVTATATGGGATVTLGLEISPGPIDPVSGFGWGAGTWGTGTWGTPRLSSAISFAPRQWSMGNFGKILISCPNNGALYFFDPSILPMTRAAVIATAPTACSGAIVTSDNIVLAYGSSLDPATALDGGPTKQNLMQWWASAQGDYTNWNVAATSGPNGSQSVSSNLREGTRIVGAADLGTHVSLVWTDTALYLFQYTGSRYVFNVQLAGKECGLISQQAMVQVSGEAYWMSSAGFKMFNGGVQNIPNYQDISEWVIQNIRPSFTVKTCCWYNQRYNEVWWAFVPNSASEPVYYVAVNRDDWTWTKGVFPETMSSATRFTGYDGRPLVFGSDGDLYQFDNGVDADGVAIPWFLTTGASELSNGDSHLEVSGIAMDMERQVGTITAQITTYDRTPAVLAVLDQDVNSFDPNDELLDFRVSGRIAQLKLSGGTALGDDFRMGIPKALLGPGGRRR